MCTDVYCIEKYEDPAGDGNAQRRVCKFDGVLTIEKYEDPAGDGNFPPPISRFIPSIGIIEKYEDPAGDGNCEPSSDSVIIFRLRNTKTPQGTETIIPALYIQKSPLIEKYEDTAGDGNVVLCT